MSGAEASGGERPLLTALVPMKAHSERIPDKNLKELGDRPLCAWILGTLRETRGVGDIVVNTDSEAIADLARRDFGATVHRRPEEIRGDTISMNRVIADDLSRLADADHFLQTHATNPFLSAATLEAAIDRYFAMREEGRDSLFAVTRRQARFYDHRGEPMNHDPDELVRTQDLAPLFEENSNFYLFSRQSFAAREHRIGTDPVWLEVEPREALDIDEPWEWALAEALLEVF